jgi:hypothetical protein
MTDSVRHSLFRPGAHSLFVAIALTAGLVSSATAQAPKLAPGLWELSLLTDGKSIIEQMGGKVPAAVLKQMRASGVHMTDTGNIQLCMSKESAHRGWKPQQLPQGCQYDVKWDGPNGQFISSCNGKTMSSGDIAIASDKGWSSTSRAKPDGGNGPMVVQVTQANWVGDDCQGLKPK